MEKTNIERIRDIELEISKISQSIIYILNELPKKL